MICSSCGSDNDKVLESRSVRGGLAIRRRRVCLECGRRFTTYEEILRDSLMVVKRDGRLEEFSRQKLLGGLTRACRKRPIALDVLEALVDGLVEKLESDFDREVPSREIGERVMSMLRELDQVAYVRFASVYRRFEDVDQFVNEIEGIHLPFKQNDELDLEQDSDG
ncbi:MAG: transcriptional repressor NrdR [Lentisphaerae bacterium]|jgi:transcriptional repressor NrdR|nr:transcriptional repressor NrdR [Lentisphaerota bacterium]